MYSINNDNQFTADSLHKNEVRSLRKDKNHIQDLQQKSLLRHEILGRTMKKTPSQVRRCRESPSRKNCGINECDILSASHLIDRILVDDKRNSTKKVRFAVLVQDSPSHIDNKFNMEGSRLSRKSHCMLTPKHEIWYQKDDYKRFKYEMSSEIHVEQLQKQKRNGVPSSYTQSLGIIYKSSFNKQIDITFSKQVIECAIRKSPSRRGVEGYFMLDAKVAAKEYRQFMVKKYGDIQNDRKLNTIMKAEALRWFSKPRTQASRKFAQIMGEIDVVTA